MSVPKHFEKCFLCNKPFELGSNVDGGRTIPTWDMTVCTSCHENNRDGIVPEVRTHLIPYLKSRGIEVKRNAKGWVDWPS